MPDAPFHPAPKTVILTEAESEDLRLLLSSIFPRLASLLSTLRQIALTLPLLALGAILQAQTQSQTQSQPAPPAPYMNRNLIVLDPAHGGQDAGASVNGQAEKSITLSLSATLKALLIARGFSVISTREGDLPDTAPLLTTDQRAGTANHLRPVACIILHATNSGSGVHLITSSLPPADEDYDPAAQIPWESAQTLFLNQSQRLANDLGLALRHAKLAPLLTRANMRPLDNLTCPALVLEFGPMPGSRPTPVTDLGYQQRIAEVVASALLSWRDTVNPRPAPRQVAAPVSGGATP